MASRFYYRPVDPGYAQFGATIANAIGGVGESFDREKARREEEERYQAQQERMDRAEAVAAAERATNEAYRQAQYGQQVYDRGGRAVDLPTPQPRMVDSITRARTEAAPAVTDPDLAPVDLPHAGLAAEAPATPGGPVSQALNAPAPTGETRWDPVLNRFIAEDPERSKAMVEEELGYLKGLKRQAQQRERQLSIINKVMEDGQISPSERGELEAEGINPDTLQPFAKIDRQHEQAKELAGIRHGHDLALLEARGERAGGTGGGAGGPESMTPNAAMELRHDNVSNLAQEMARQGLTAGAIRETLAEQGWVDAVGGYGVLTGLVRAAVQGAPISGSTMTEAAKLLEEERLTLSRDEYLDELFGLASEIERRRAAGEGAADWSTPEAPGAEAGRSDASTIRGIMEFDPSAPILLGGSVLRGSSEPTEGGSTSGLPDLPPEDATFIDQYLFRNPNATEDEVEEALEAHREGGGQTPPGRGGAVDRARTPATPHARAIERMEGELEQTQAQLDFLERTRENAPDTITDRQYERQRERYLQRVAELTGRLEHFRGLGSRPGQ